MGFVLEEEEEVKANTMESILQRDENKCGAAGKFWEALCGNQ